MSQSKQQSAFRYTYRHTNDFYIGRQKTVGSDYQKVSAAAQHLSRSFEGRQLLQAAADLEGDDLRALANFATAASRGAW